MERTLDDYKNELIKLRIEYDKIRLNTVKTEPLIYKKMAEIITAVGSVSKDRTSVGKFS